MSTGVKLPRIGRKVLIRRRVRTITGHMDQHDYPGGVVINKPIDDYSYWNVEDCKPYRKRKPTGDPR